MLEVSSKVLNKLYKWRINYPHCENVYFRHRLEESEKRYLYNPYHQTGIKVIAFNVGGFVFLSNPFIATNFKLKIKPNSHVVDAMNLDNIAEYADDSYEYKTEFSTIGSRRGIEERKSEA